MNTPNKTTPAPSVADEIKHLRHLARSVGLDDEQTARFRVLMQHEVEELDRNVAAIGDSRAAHAKALEELDEAARRVSVTTPAALVAFLHS